MSMQRDFGVHHDEIVELSRLMLAVWQAVDPDSAVAQSPASYVETFTDMAKVVVTSGYHREAGAAALRDAAADFANAAALGVEPVLNRTAAKLLLDRAERLDRELPLIDTYGYPQRLLDAAGVSARTPRRELGLG